MITFTDRATALLETLKNAARDMESDLGKASRVTEYNPLLGNVTRLTETRHQPAGLAQTRERLLNEYGAAHRINALVALDLIGTLVRSNGGALTGPEQAIADQIATLANQMKTVGTAASAKALVDSL